MCIIQSRVLPALYVGKCINWCRLNMFRIPAKLQMSIQSGKFHGILKSPSIVGWKFSLI